MATERLRNWYADRQRRIRQGLPRKNQERAFHLRIESYKKVYHQCTVQPPYRKGDRNPEPVESPKHPEAVRLLLGRQKHISGDGVGSGWGPLQHTAVPGINLVSLLIN